MFKPRCTKPGRNIDNTKGSKMLVEEWTLFYPLPKVRSLLKKYKCHHANLICFAIELILRARFCRTDCTVLKFYYLLKRVLNFINKSTS